MIETPVEIVDDLHRARKLEWWTLAGMASVIAVMAFAMGQSQAMRTAFVEDVLSLVPAITFLIAARFEPRPPSERYPFGFVRVNSLAFFISAVVLTTLGALLLFEGFSTLMKREHVTIPPIELFGQQIWLGWVMIAALAYSVIVPVVLGHLKKPVAQRLQDKVLHTDADMQKADWKTGLAGIVGVLGVGLGFWWADAAAAAAISLSILKDGFKNMRGAAAELLDSVPRALEGTNMAPDARRLRERLEARFPDAHVRLRESGRYILANVGGAEPPDDLPPLGDWMGQDQRWRLAQLSFTPKGCAMSDAMEEKEDENHR
ncbi:cation diffusion facilitator family transporter [Qipengyuania sediminis]|uniref:cation diffusion facilitator family transporter n=1 Tax=Qipengyuania sediminis TaxID=1532023 RepID=UPI001059CBBA|nr:cation diffusion facilitator family transporter [Qipengyuania sediminis]